MKVAVDQVWATPSTLHMRVIVYASDNRWRQKHQAAVPLSEIPEEAIAALLKVAAAEPREPYDQDPLF